MPSVSAAPRYPALVQSQAGVFVGSRTRVNGRFGPWAASVAADLLVLFGVVLAIPLAILAVGLPVALVLRIVLWIAGLLG